jgi:bifunctional DNase/RNase
MKKVELEIAGLSYSHTQSGAYALVFNETKGNRRLPIIIGGTEAQAIAIELEGMTPSRPLTHDLFKSFAEEFEFTIQEVIIYNLIEGIFFSKLICRNKEGNTIEIDSRTSDAVAIAVRFACPIFTYEFILSSAGIILDDEGEEENLGETKSNLETESSPIELSESDSVPQKSIEELEKELNEAIEAEDYEKASQLRDQINSRN